MSMRSRDVADELKKVIRLAGRNPEGLEGELPALSGLYRVTSAGVLDEAARVHFILYRLIPEYLQRLPPGRDGRAIRELLTWEDEEGEWRPLTTRYHKAAGHLVNAASDFGRRQEPRLLLECARRFIALDHDDRLGAASTASAVAAVIADSAPASLLTPPAEQSPVAGIVRVHKNLDLEMLGDCMADADEIVILNTWIPGLDILADALIDALARGTYVSILMLHPDSHIAQLRSQALQASTQARFHEDRVQPGVRNCLEVLAAISRTVSEDCRRNLRVRLYHSLPSISVYGIDDRAFFSVFLHGHLAIKSVQIEVQGQDSLMGRLVFRELETLWEMGYEVKEMDQWQSELKSMRQSFGIAP